jgi:hypothetical protein
MGISSLRDSGAERPTTVRGVVPSQLLSVGTVTVLSLAPMPNMWIAFCSPRSLTAVYYSTSKAAKITGKKQLRPRFSLRFEVPIH